MMKQAREFPVFTVTPKAARSLAAGHPWVYAQEVLAAQPCENGALADVFSQKGSWLGTGLVSLQSKIRVRIFSRNANDVFDEAFWHRRLRYAWEYRKAVMGPDVSNCRIIFGEADQFPGLTVDRYGTLLSAQVLSAGMERLKHTLFPALVQMLRGAKDQKTLERGLDQFPTYGIMRDVPPQRMRLYLDALQEQGYLAETGDEFPVITLTAKAPAVLFHGEQVTMQERAATAQETQAKRRPSRKKTAARTALSEADDSLLASLKTLRSELAQKNHVPAYIVFNNVSLDEMAELKPRTMGDFRRISGVGDAKAAKYGEAFIKHIAKWVREHSEEE